MGLWTDLARRALRPRGAALLRRILAEQRAQRHALDRLADAVEFAVSQHRPAGMETFRTFRRPQGHGSGPTEAEVAQQTSVEYVDNTQLAMMLEVEDRLRRLLGRDPSEVEMERALAGEIDVREVQVRQQERR